MFYLFIIPLVFALTGILFFVTPQLHLINHRVLIWTTLLICTAPWIIPDNIRANLLNGLNSQLGNITSQWPIIIPLLVGMMGFISLKIFSKWKYAIFVALAFLSISNLLQPQSSFFMNKECWTSKDLFKATIAADKFATALDPTLRTKYWFKKGEVTEPEGHCGPISLDNIFDSITATRIWCVSWVSGCSPANSEEVREEALDQHQQIGILSSLKNKAKYASDLQNRFAQLGKTLHPLGKTEINVGQIKFAISLFEVKLNSPAIPQIIQRAVQYHQAGYLPLADVLYRQILQVQPNNTEALHLLGILAAQLKNYEVAVALMKQAIAINNSVPIYYSNLAGALFQQGNLTEAATCYQRALMLNPNDAASRQLLEQVFQTQSQRVREGKTSRRLDNASPCVVK